MKKLIGFAGPAGCGKSTAAYMIANHLYYGEVLSFATPLKACLQSLFKFSSNQLHTLEGKERIDPRYGVSPRTIMQQFATDFVRTTVPYLWCTLMEQEIKDTVGPVLIDDVRFNDEANLIRDLGGVIVHINGRAARIEGSSHSSEKGVFMLDKDIPLDNSGTLEELEAELSYKLLGILRD